MRIQDHECTRRDAMLASVAAVTAPQAMAQAGGAPTAVIPTTGAPPASGAVSSASVKITVNGTLHTMKLDTRTTLLDALREHLHLTGTKKGCDHGQCGACTVLAQGRRINACLSLAVMHDGGSVTTIEGLGTPERLHPMQAAFVEHDGLQCGYCTSGQICSAVGALNEIAAGIPSHVSADLNARPVLSADELRERLSGNICRCGAYSNIIAAVSQVAGSRT